MSGLRFRFDIWTIILIFAWAVMALLLIWPLSTILLASFHDNDTGAWSLTNYVDALSARSYRRAIGNTFLVGFGGMIGALLLGTTLAFLTTRFRVRGRALVQTLAVVALVSPPFIGAYAWIVLFGANGVARNSLSQIGLTIPTIYGAGGVILVFAFKFFPHVFLIVSGALGAVNRSVEEAAESLGMSPMRRLLSVTFPLILPSLTAAALLTFVLSIADFGTPRLIGRDLNVLATEAFVQFGSEMGGNPGMASALSMILIVISMALVALQRRMTRANVYAGNLLKRPEERTLAGWPAFALHAGVYVIVLIGALPAITAVIFSFRRTSGPVFQPGFSTQSYERVIANVATPIWNSMIYSTIAVVMIMMPE